MTIGLTILCLLELSEFKELTYYQFIRVVQFQQFPSLRLFA